MNPSTTFVYPVVNNDKTLHSYDMLFYAIIVCNIFNLFNMVVFLTTNFSGENTQSTQIPVMYPAVRLLRPLTLAATLKQVVWVCLPSRYVSLLCTISISLMLMIICYSSHLYCTQLITVGRSSRTSCSRSDQSLQSALFEFFGFLASEIPNFPIILTVVFPVEPALCEVLEKTIYYF